MAIALQMEVRKLLTTRLWWILLVVMAVLLAAAVAGLSLLATTDAAQQAGNLALADPESVALVYNLTPAFGFVFPLLLGALSLTSEYRYQTITASFLARPRRWMVVTAKALLSLVVGLVFGVVGTLVCVGTGSAVLAATGHQTFATDPVVWRSLLGGIVATSLWGLLGFGVGAIVRNQVVAVVVIIAATQFVEPFLRLLLTSVSGTADLARLLPGAASDATSVDTLFSAASSLPLLSPGAGALVLLGYAALLVGVGVLRTTRRSIA
ncbi:ABC transporter permease subunit [uncultured Cellulomonas sp.]|uniref:ABC transporter permease subunit n=1 Tax=uncultured Cellulomonas sp. TaxID=189682 RepID=UPI0028E1C198|nr:ABC transporter permease subunit [uncultured Cellulomonas sp.]